MGFQWMIEHMANLGLVTAPTARPLIREYEKDGESESIRWRQKGLAL